MKRQERKLPEGWDYTGKRLCDTLREGGVAGRFYYEPEIQAIYQVTRIKKKSGGYHPLVELGDWLEARVRFVNPENPRKSKVVENLGSRMKATDFPLDTIFNDEEVEQVTC